MRVTNATREFRETSEPVTDGIDISSTEKVFSLQRSFRLGCGFRMNMGTADPVALGHRGGRISASCRFLQPRSTVAGGSRSRLRAQFGECFRQKWESKGRAVSIGNVIPTENASAFAGLPFQQDVQAGSWYAIQTRSRHERVAACQLKTCGIVQYCPTVVETHKWSDRHRKIEKPLFPGYIFARVAASNECRLAVLRTQGVLRIVGSAPLGTPIPDEQIDSVKALLGCNLPWTFYPFLKAGQRVRIRGGALDGVEGVFVKRAGVDTLIISIEVLQRSLSVSIQGYALDPL